MLYEIVPITKVANMISISLYIDHNVLYASYLYHASLGFIFSWS